MFSLPDRARAPRCIFVVAAVGALAAACGQVRPDDLSSACDALVAAHATYEARCVGAPADVATASAACIDQATLPGSRVTATLLDECRVSLEAAARNCGSGEPTCFGPSGTSWLFPEAAPLGSLRAGSPCVAAHQCADGHCTDELGHGNFYAGDGTVSCRTCRAPVDVGQPCDPARDVCLSRLSPGSAAACQDGSCAFREGLAFGESCMNYGPDPCRADLRCDSTAGTTDGTCTSRLPLGASCEPSDAACELGAVCTNGLCTRRVPDCTADADCSNELRCFAGTCVTGSMVVGEGEACGTCGTGLECVDGTCRYPAYRVEGQSCASESSCSPELVCDLPCDDPRACAATCRRGGPGTPCSRDYTCEGELTCDFDVDLPGRGTCVANVQNARGQPCPCTADLVCANGTCEAWSGVCPSP